jgi:acyl carrier protein
MTELMQQMADYIVRDIIRRPGIAVDEDTPLVSSGLIDSLALVDILHKLERLTARKISAGKVQPKDMDTLRLMFATSERVGKPRS